MTKPTHKSIAQEEQIALDKLLYNSHYIGELGKFIRIGYAENILKDYGNKRDRIAREEEREKEADNGYRCRKNTAESLLIKIRHELGLQEGESVLYAIRALTTPLEANNDDVEVGIDLARGDYSVLLEPNLNAKHSGDNV